MSGRLDGLATGFIKRDCVVQFMWCPSGHVQYVWRQVSWPNEGTQRPPDTQVVTTNTALCVRSVVE